MTQWKNYLNKLDMTDYDVSDFLVYFYVFYKFVRIICKKDRLI